VGEERLERAIDQGVTLARSLGRLPKFADWKEARLKDSELMSEWQVYRMLEPGGGAWATFQYLVRERLLEAGVEVSPEGSVSPGPRTRPLRTRGSSSRPSEPSSPSKPNSKRERS
jgi:hypothetical protein